MATEVFNAFQRSACDGYPNSLLFKNLYMNGICTRPQINAHMTSSSFNLWCIARRQQYIQGIRCLSVLSD
jgi:hypothetical protein